MAHPCSCCGAQPNMPPNLTPRSARMTDLLHSNTSPLSTEEVSFRAELPVRANRIGSLDASIAVARRVLHSLIHQRHQEVRDINDIHAVMHPIRNIPSDVLREIFLYCLDDQDPRADSLDTHGMPWVLVQVCSQWRMAGVSFPRLWARVHVSFDTLALHPHPERLAHVLWLQLSRSKQYQLEVELSSYTHVSDMHPILPHLWETSNRWRTLALDLTDASIRNVLAPTHGKLHALELVSIKAPASHLEEEDTGFDVLSDIGSAPALRALHVSGSPASLSIPWSRLEEYVYQRANYEVPTYYREDPHATLDNNLSLLRKMDAVRIFKSRCTDRYPFHLMDAPMRRENITSMWLEAPKLADMGISALLAMLELPALKSFGWIRAVDIDAIRGLLRRSRCTLSTIGLKSHNFTQGLRDFLQESDSVESLVLKDETSPAVLSWLSNRLPALALLDMSDLLPSAIDEKRLWRLVHSRRRKLKEVRLPDGYLPEVPVEEQYAELIKEGLTIGLYYN